ncbi:MAG: hypothetical protein HKN74_02305 [Acidimicrobiia bacterium]|nr:hypothetical protein [Acidimicrobiia bacterium]
MHPVELSVRYVLMWLLPGLLAGVALLAVPRPDDPFLLFIVHLTGLVGFGIALAVGLTRFLDDEAWFAGTGWRPGRIRFAAAALLVALDTGAVALLTLASSAALRLDPSLQFLQLLSALDIAWAGAAIVFGMYLLRRTRTAAWAGGIALGAFCIYSVWQYLDVVGFTPAGGWLVSGSDLMRYVIPFDMAAAIVAVIVLWRGAHAGLRTEQATLQS